jgi:hypothetical protein
MPHAFVDLDSVSESLLQVNGPGRTWHLNLIRKSFWVYILYEESRLSGIYSAINMQRAVHLERFLLYSSMFHDIRT